MALSRRKFLKSGILVALSATIPLKIANTAAGQQRSPKPVSPGTVFQVPYESQTDPVYYFKKSTFSPYLNTIFRIHYQPKKVMSLRLIRVTDAGPVDGRKADAAVGKECFSIIFRAPLYSQPLSQKTYQIEHGALGTFNLFLAYKGKDRYGLNYEALINHRMP